MIYVCVKLELGEAIGRIKGFIYRIIGKAAFLESFIKRVVLAYCSMDQFERRKKNTT